MDSTAHEEELDLATRRLWRRRVAGAGILVVAVAVMALIPPLVNVNRYQRRITSTLSASLGRDVHLDSVSVHLLPFPGLTLTNFVVSEDPAFGAEPTIRANSVEAHLRLSSLWRRHIEFSTVRFIDPSLNLVRNPQGRWNLDNVLVHAARIDAAPTEQRSAGGTPRFPYIEATGARVNIKLGEEKMPFALTEAEFALWLPTAQQWRVRLVARPTRTDTNIADPGTLRVEGALQKANKLELVPVDLRASWHDAPLGEATLLMTGHDMGWRGAVHIDASLQGPLGAAAVQGDVTVDGLRRADFVPHAPLDVAAHCTATANAALAQLTGAKCMLPVGDGTPPLMVSSARIDLADADSAPVSIDADKLPLPWLFTWFKILSPRVPDQAAPAGTLDVHLARSAPSAWTGHAQLYLAAVQAANNAAHPAASTIGWTVGPSSTRPGCPVALTSPPTPIQLPPNASVTVASELSVCGYTFHATGVASEAELMEAAQPLPQIVDGVHDALAEASQPGPSHLDLSCTRAWGEEQVCTAAAHPVPAATHHPSRRAPR